MANPLDYTQVVVKFARDPKKDGSVECPIIHSNGRQMGTVKRKKRSLPVRFLKFVNFKKFLAVFPYMGFGFETTIFDSDEKPIMIFKKKFDMNKFEVAIHDQAGRVVGNIKQVPPDSKVDEVSKKTQYNLTNYKGQIVAHFLGDWSSWNMMILDNKENTIGKLHKGYTNVNKVVHGSGDFFVGEIYEGKIDKLSQHLIMGVAACMDIIANE